MKLSTFCHFSSTLIFLLGYATFSWAASNNSPSSIGFQFCLDKNCSQSKINFSPCSKNARNENGTCICLDGFIGNGKYCIKPTCPDGSYSLVTEQGAEKCEVCPEGYFCQKGVEKECPDNFVSEKGSSSCTKCPDGTYAIAETATCCPDGEKYDFDKKECVLCSEGQNCGCPSDTPYSDGNGECVECLTDENCPSGFCSNHSCCPANSSTIFQRGIPLNNGCYCLSGYEPDTEQENCVMTDCSQVENSSPTGKGDKTSLEGCFCNITHPHWQNGRCMRAKDCTVLMEQYGFKKGKDFLEDYKKDDQTFLNTIYMLHSFKTPSNMDLTGCNLIIDGDFQNNHKLTVDSLYINFSNFLYREKGTGKNSGTIITKGLTASKFINDGNIFAQEASVNFGYFENRGNLYADSIYELNDGSSIIKNLGTINITNDFLFGAVSDNGYVQNVGKIIVGGDWESNTIYNWGKIVVHKTLNKEDIEIHNEGSIVVKQDE